VSRDVEVRSRNYICIAKATRITYSECVSVALIIQHAVRMRPIVICGLSGSDVDFHIITKSHDFGKKLLNIN